MKNLIIVSKLLSVIMMRTMLIALGGTLAFVQWSVLVSFMLAMGGISGQILSPLPNFIGSILMLVVGPRRNEWDRLSFLGGMNLAGRELSVSDLYWSIKFALILGPFGAFARLIIFLERL